MPEPIVAVATVNYAAELWRLDLASSLLTAVGLLTAFAGTFGYLNIKSSSKRTAKRVSTKVAREEAERAANLYLQEHLPAMISEYDDFIKNQINASVADNIAGAQEDSGNDNN